MQRQDQKKIKREGFMRKIKLNESVDNKIIINEYKLLPNEKYIIDIDDEWEYQKAIYTSFRVMGSPPAIKNYHAWLFENGFNVEEPNPTNEFVAQYYGVKPLWKTDYSQGIVVRNERDNDYYIVMECSNKNKGYKHAIVILTLGGCM